MVSMSNMIQLTFVVLTQMAIWPLYNSLTMDRWGLENFRMDKYQSYYEIMDWMRRIATKYPKMARIASLPDGGLRSPIRTHEGRYMDFLVIGSRSKNVVGKPAVWIDAGMHAREWISTAVALVWINTLVTGYVNKDPKLLQMIEHIDFYILPVLNPDGYEESRNNNRLWRKNMNPVNSGQPNCVGVDLNRNFRWHWGETKTDDPCEENYAGPYPFSEKESQGLRNQLKFMKKSTNLVAYISLHSSGQMWMYPYGHDKDALPANWWEMNDVAQKVRRKIYLKTGKVYKVGQKASTLYITSGTSVDFAKGQLGIKYSYLVELPPTKAETFTWVTNDEFGNQIAHTNAFSLPPHRIVPSAIESFYGLEEMVNQILLYNDIQPLKGVYLEPADWMTHQPCTDNFQECYNLGRVGYCQAHQLAMELSCTRACGFCR